MTRSTPPTIPHAEGMLAAIRATHDCTVACNGTTVLGDGKVLHLTCPWERLDMRNAEDRRIVQTVYASEARAALATTRKGA